MEIIERVLKKKPKGGVGVLIRKVLKNLLVIYILIMEVVVGVDKKEKVKLHQIVPEVKKITQKELFYKEK